MVASSGANLFTSISAGICALSGPLHGGANAAVMHMLQSIHDEGDDGTRFIAAAKSGSKSNRLMGFGHAVYRNYDPRARIIGAACDKLLTRLSASPILCSISPKTSSRPRCTTNISSRASSTRMSISIRASSCARWVFPRIFSPWRHVLPSAGAPGWIANWREVASNAKGRIYRPRRDLRRPGQTRLRVNGQACGCMMSRRGRRLRCEAVASGRLSNS